VANDDPNTYGTSGATPDICRRRSPGGSGRRLRTSAVAFVSMQALSCGAPSSPCDPRPGEICTIVGTGDTGFNRDGLAGPETDLYLPSAARRGPDGALYVMDFNNQRLRRVAEDGSVQTVIGDGFHAIATTEVDALDTPLENPIDFAFLSDGTLIFVSYHDPRVLILGEDNELHNIAGTGEIALRGDEGDGGSALEASFDQLDGIAITRDDAVIVSDSKAHRVRQIEDGVVSTIAGDGEPDYAGDEGPATEASLQWPTALELDDDGALLIADTRNHVVRRLSTDGILTTIAGNGTKGDDGDGGNATEAELDQPNGLALDPQGNLYIADRGNFKIRRVTPDGEIDTIAGSGERGDAGDGGPALQAQFGFLARIAWDDGALLIADQTNSKIRSMLLP